MTRTARSFQFEHVASVQDVSFRVSWSDTLQAAWDIAYLKLGEQRRPDDRLQTDDGVDMMPFLGETLRQLFDNKHTKSHKFQIVGPTGERSHDCADACAGHSRWQGGVPA